VEGARQKKRFRPNQGEGGGGGAGGVRGGGGKKKNEKRHVTRPKTPNRGFKVKREQGEEKKKSVSSTQNGRATDLKKTKPHKKKKTKEGEGVEFVSFQENIGTSGSKR